MGTVGFTKFPLEFTYRGDAHRVDDLKNGISLILEKIFREDDGCGFRLELAEHVIIIRAYKERSGTHMRWVVCQIRTDTSNYQSSDKFIPTADAREIREILINALPKFDVFFGVGALPSSVVFNAGCC